jgi:hypothetical protein
VNNYRLLSAALVALLVAVIGVQVGSARQRRAAIPGVCFVSVEIKPSADPAVPGIFPVPLAICYPGQAVVWTVVNGMPAGSKQIKVDLAFGTKDPAAGKVNPKQVGPGEVTFLQLRLKAKTDFHAKASCIPATQLCYDTPFPYVVTLDGKPAPDPDLQVTPPPDATGPPAAGGSPSQR